MHPKLLALRRFVCFALAAAVVLPLVARGDERADAIAAPQGVVAHGGMVVAQEARAAQVGVRYS